MEQRTKQKILFFFLLLVPFIWALSNSMIIPILPRAQELLNISKVKAGLIITALSVPTAIFLPITGFLSDRYGRVTIMIPTILLYGFGGLAAGVAAIFNSYPLLILSRCLQGIGATGTSLLALSYVGDLYQDNQQAKFLSYLETSNSIGKLISPVISTLAAQIAWYGAFFVFPIFAVPVATGLFLFQIKPRCNKRNSDNLTNYFSGLTHFINSQKFLILIASSATFITIFLWFGNLYFLSELMEIYFHVTPFLHGILLSIPVLVMAITTAFTGKCLMKFCFLKLIYLGLLIIGTAITIALILPDKFMLYGMVPLIGVGFGLVLPCLNALIVGGVESKNRGVVTTFYGSIRALGSALGPLVFGITLEYDKSLTLISGGALAIFTALVVKLTSDRYNTR